jgi:hypothetical protein
MPPLRQVANRADQSTRPVTDGAVMTNEDVEKILRNQLAMNPKTWAALVARGVTTETPLSLDFAYIAPGEPQAVALRAFLTTQTDYVIDVQSAKKGALSRRSWEVVGRTNPQPLSLAVLEVVPVVVEFEVAVPRL